LPFEYCECYATISKDDPRSEIWRHVKADGQIPLKHPLVVTATGGPFVGEKFYEGDPSRLTGEEKVRLVERLCEKFELTADEVRHELDMGILPIRADNVIVSICPLHFRCMA
jgi:hypothetical protein